VSLPVLSRSNTSRRSAVRPKRAASQLLRRFDRCRQTCRMDRSADASADETTDGRWLSYAELANLRGIDHHSARRLVSRQRWRRQKDNHGVVRIYVPPEHLGHRRRHREASADTSAGTPAVRSADISTVIKPLEDAIAALREQLAEANSRVEAAEARASRAEATRDAQIAAADVFRDRIEALTAELRDARQASEELRQADMARQARGLLARLRAALRGE